jgi:cytidylate kinase
MADTVDAPVFSAAGGQEHSGASRMRAVTVSREYGSGGGEMARRLAARLGWQLVDHEVVALVARELGMSLQEAADQDEQVESFAARLLATLQAIEPVVLPGPPLAQPRDAQAYHAAVCRVVQAAVAQGPVVIVGRAAQRMLADRRDVLHVRIVAPFERRVRYVSAREGLSEPDAADRIQQRERARARYLQTFYGVRPDDPQLYDLVVNTGALSLDHAVALAARALELKASRLGVPEELLGPGVGLAPYPGLPQDFQLGAEGQPGR